MGPRLTLSGSTGSSPFPLLGARNRTRPMVDGGWDGAFPMEDKEPEAMGWGTFWAPKLSRLNPACRHDGDFLTRLESGPSVVGSSILPLWKT